ncbi:MAG: hypothetical protein KDE53_04685 [Caldilineaceae bacterium]|nr:hypothetical protein [Caldilineaceae bacterium]
MHYQIEKWQRVVVDAPDICEDDLMSLTEGAKLLQMTTQALDHYIRQGELSIVTAPGAITAHRRPRRWLLKTEIENLQIKLSK